MRKVHLVGRKELQWRAEAAARDAELEQLKAYAEAWLSAQDFLFETGAMKAFLLWEAKRLGATDFAYAALDRATDKFADVPTSTPI